MPACPVGAARSGEMREMVSRRPRFPRRRHTPHLGRRDLHSRIRRLRAPRPTGRLRPVQSVRTRRRSGAFDEQRGARIGLRLKVGAATVVVLFGMLGARLYSLQIVNGSQLNGLARQTALKDIEVPAMRGEIFTRSGGSSGVLAGNRSEWVISISQQNAQLNPQVIGALAALLPGETVSAINTALASLQYQTYQPIPIATGVAPATVLYIQEHPSLFPGVVANQAYVRTYPYNNLAAQAIGYVGDINLQELKALQGQGYTAQSQIGQSGLESQYESQLHGATGIQQILVGPAGNAVSTVSRTPAVPGDNLYLNMDLGLEQATANALSSQLRTLRTGANAVAADFGAAVVLDARNGAVLAMSSAPSYNNNEWIPYMTTANYAALLNATGRPLNNYAIVGAEAPGSTFKLATATAALDQGLITGSTLYDDTGTFTIGKPPNVKVLHDAGGEVLGVINVSLAIGESSDVFFYNLGARFCQQDVGCPTQIQQYAARYGFGLDPGIDLPGATAGQVDSPQLRKYLHQIDPAAYPNATYYQGDNVETAFGQGETLVTPLQLAEAYATFANGGTRYAPEMVAALVSPSGSVKRVAPKVLGHVPLPASTYQPMLQGFEDATQYAKGTAYGPFVGFDFKHWNIAGKTGTATSTRLIQPTSWFVAFGGPRNAPARYVVAVEVDQGGYGASASAPVVRKIFDYLYHHGIAPLRVPK